MKAIAELIGFSCAFGEGFTFDIEANVLAVRLEKLEYESELFRAG